MQGMRTDIKMTAKIATQHRMINSNSTQAHDLLMGGKRTASQMEEDDYERYLSEMFEDNATKRIR